MGTWNLQLDGGRAGYRNSIISWYNLCLVHRSDPQQRAGERKCERKPNGIRHEGFPLSSSRIHQIDESHRRSRRETQEVTDRER